MTIHEFTVLSDLDKVTAIMQYGHLIAQHAEENSRVFFYRMEGFYVSATYSLPNDQLTGICCFRGADEEQLHFHKKLTAIHPAERNYSTPDA
jgi:hypothetical protein